MKDITPAKSSAVTNKTIYLEHIKEKVIQSSVQGNPNINMLEAEKCR